MISVKKLKMPKSGKGEPEMDMSDMHDDESAEMSPDDEQAEGESPDEAMPEESPLADVSDDDLIAEMRKRGLKLDESGDQESGPNEEDQYV